MVYRVVNRLLASLVCAIVLGAPGTAQQPLPPDPAMTPPSLSQGVLRKSTPHVLLTRMSPTETRDQKLRVRVTLRAARGDHAALFIGLAPGATAYAIPGLPSTVPLKIANALMFGSTLDGRVELDPNGRWTTDLEFPAAIRSAMPRVHFQAAVIRPVHGALALLISDPLEVDLQPEPANRLQQLLQSSRSANARWAPATDPTPDFFIDPFGNRILQSRTWR